MRRLRLHLARPGATIPGVAALAVAGGAAFLAASVAAPSGETPSETRWVMGTTLRVDVRHPSPATARDARREALDLAQRIDNLLSDSLPYTPLSRLNAAAGGGPVPVPPEVARYLRSSQRDARRTDGAFDVTAGGRVVGVDRVTIGTTPDGGDVASLPEGTVIDPGGNGKGVAVDAIVPALQARGVRRALVDFGNSSVYALGAPEGEAAWRIAIRDANGKILGSVALSDRALSVSSALPPPPGPGASRRPHIVDPRTGSPVRARRTTAVVSRSATDADVLSTALVVEGARGAHWRERFDGAEFAVFEAGEEPWMTPGFARLFASAP